MAFRFGLRPARPPARSGVVLVVDPVVPAFLDVQAVPLEQRNRGDHPRGQDHLAIDPFQQRNRLHLDREEPRRPGRTPAAGASIASQVSARWASSTSTTRPRNELGARIRRIDHRRIEHDPGIARHVARLTTPGDHHQHQPVADEMRLDRADPRRAVNPNAAQQHETEALDQRLCLPVGTGATTPNSAHRIPSPSCRRDAVPGLHGAHTGPDVRKGIPCGTTATATDLSRKCSIGVPWVLAVIATPD